MSFLLFITSEPILQNPLHDLYIRDVILLFVFAWHKLAEI